MKKLLTFFIVLLLAICIVGCGEEQNNPEDNYEEIATELLSKVKLESSDNEALSAITKDLNFVGIVNDERAKDVTLEWKSSKDIIDKDGKVIQGEEDTEVTITVVLKYQGVVLTKDFNVTVLGKGKTVDVDVAKINVTGNTELKEGEVYQFTATIEPNEATNKEVVWSSSDGEVASVDADGKVTALKVGAAKIIATSKGGTIKGELEVNVTAKAADGKITISEAVKKQAGDEVAVEGTIVGKYAQGFMIYDGTDYILVYIGKNYDNSYNVGEYVKVSGALGTYKERNQFTSTCTIEKLSEGTDYVLNETELDLAALTGFVDAVEFGKKVKVTMKVTSKTSSYINSLVGDSTEIGLCVTYPFSGDDFEVDNEYEVTGYALYASTYNNVKSLYIMLESAKAVGEGGEENPPVPSEKITIKIASDALTLKDSFVVNKFGYSGVYDPDLSGYIWFVTKDQIENDESGFGFYERFGLYESEGKLYVGEYLAGDGLKSLKGTNFDYVLMASPKTINKAKFDAIKVGDVLVIDALAANLEIGFVEVDAKLYSQEFEVKEYDKTDDGVVIEAPAKEGFEFLGWVKLNSSEKEYVDKFTENVTVVGLYRSKVLYVDANDPLKYSSIAAAVSASQAGDTIVLAPGVYTEEVLVNKGVTITSIIEDSVLENKAVYKDVTKAAIIKGKIYVTGANVKIEHLTFTEAGKVAFYGGSNDVLNNFVFESNYVYETNADLVAWKDNGSYGVGSSTAAGLWSKYPGVVCLAGYYAWVTNAQILDNVFEDVAGTAVYNCVERHMVVKGNVFNNIGADAVRLDYGNAYGTFLFEDNRFVNVGATAIFLRSYGANDAAYINVRSNMFKNCGFGDFNATRSIPGAYASTAYQEKTNAIILFEYNVFEKNNGNISLRANVSNTTTYAGKNLTYTLDVKYNAFIMNSNEKVNKSFFGSDSASTNWAVGTFENNFYGLDYDEKFDIVDDNFENILAKDTITYANIQELASALPEGAKLPEFDEVTILPLTQEAKSIIDEVNPTIYVCQNIEEGKIYKTNGKRLSYGVDLFASLEAALALCTGGEKIFLFAGTYGDITITVSDITLCGESRYNLVHTDVFEIGDNDTVFGSITADGIDELSIMYAVVSKQVLINDIKGFVAKDLVSLCNTDGAFKFTGNNEGLEFADIFYTGSAPRVIYVATGTTKDVAIDHLVILDSASVVLDANGKYSSGICDTIRFGQATAAKVAAGKISLTNSYLRGGQSGIMDRFPDADEYIISGNFFVGIPAAVYFRSASITKEIKYTIQYNTFIECGNSINDWDVVAVTTGANTNVKANYNAFIDSFPFKGTYTDYVLKIRKAEGVIDCSNNFINVINETTKNLNATGFSYADNTYYVTDQVYELYSVIAVGNSYGVYGYNVISAEDYAQLNRGTADAPLTVEEAARFIKGMSNKTFDDINYGYVTGVVESVSYNSKYDSYTAILNQNGTKLTVYSGNLDTGLLAFNVGDTVVAKGYFELYNSTLELAGDTSHEYPIYIDITRPVVNVTVSIESSDKAEVVLDQTTIENGGTITFTVNVANGYIISKVTVNGNAATFADGKYSAKAVGDSVVLVTTSASGASLPETSKAQYTGSTTTNMVAEENNAATLGLDPAIFTVTSLKNGASNFAGLNKDGTIRIYGKAGEVGTSINVLIAEGYTINTVSLSVKSGTAYAVKVDNDIEGVAGVYTINGNSFTIYQTGANATQVQLYYFEIEYVLGEGGNENPQNPIEPSDDDIVVKATYSGATSNMVAEENNAATIGLDPSIFTVLAFKNNSSTLPGLNKDGTIRIYGSNGNIGGEISFTIKDGYIIKSVKITTTSGTAYAVKTNEDIEAVNGVYTINGNSFSIYQTGANSTQVRMSEIEITFVPID